MAQGQITCVTAIFKTSPLRQRSQVKVFASILHILCHGPGLQVIMYLILVGRLVSERFLWFSG